MFGLLSVFKFSKKENYEAVLAELDDKIKAAELRLADLKLQRGYYSGSTFLYLTVLYIIYVPLYIFFLRNPYVDDWYKTALKAAPLIGVPVLLYFIRSVLDYFFARRVLASEDTLKALRVKQKIKVEELKKNSSYYQTKSLIDRYSENPKRDFVQPPIPQNGRKPTPASNTGIQPPRSLPGKSNTLSGKMPQAQKNHNQTLVNKEEVSSISTSLPLSAGPERRWYDKLVDAIVGEEQNTVPQFALICQHCYCHNGLVSPNEYETIQYKCPSCNKFNPSKRSMRRKSLDTQDLPTAQKPTPQQGMIRATTHTPKVRQQLPSSFRPTQGPPLPLASEPEQETNQPKPSTEEPTQKIKHRHVPEISFTRAIITE